MESGIVGVDLLDHDRVGIRFASLLVFVSQSSISVALVSLFVVLPVVYSSTSLYQLIVLYPVRPGFRSGVSDVDRYSNGACGSRTLYASCARDKDDCLMPNARRSTGLISVGDGRRRGNSDGLTCSWVTGDHSLPTT